MEKIQEFFKQENVKAVVKRPTIKGELRIFGFDISVGKFQKREYA